MCRADNGINERYLAVFNVEVAFAGYFVIPHHPIKWREIHDQLATHSTVGRDT